MSSVKLRQCPNCGSYVVTDSDFCPRCDHPLDQPPAPAEDAGEQPMEDDAPPSPMTEAVTLIEDHPPEPDRADLPTTLIPPAAEEPTEIAPPEPAAPDETGDEFTIPNVPPPPAESPALFIMTGEEATWETEMPGISEELTVPSGLPEAAADEDTDPHDQAVAGVLPAPALAPPPFIAPPPTRQPSDEQIATPARQPEPSRPYLVPPAPYTPPPLPPPVAAAYAPGYAPGAGYFQQRVQAYLNGGYKPLVIAPYEATLARGKNLSVGTWLLALISIVGVLWYLLILAIGGFGKDRVYISLEPTGYVYEDGPGAAHVRRQRSRAGRRWSVFGLIVFIAALILVVGLSIAAAAMLSQERYQAALRQAYPAVTLFEEQFHSGDASDADIALMKNGAVIVSILGGIGLLGIWGGATLFVVGAVHASAYRTRVPPLPGYA